MSRGERGPMGASLDIAGRAIVIGVAVYGAVRLANDVDNRFDNEESVRAERGLQHKLDLYTAGELSQSELVSEYKYAKASYGAYSDYNLSLSSSGDVLNEVNDERMELVSDGVFIADSLDHEEQIKNIDEDSATFSGEEFDLKNEYDLYLLNALVDAQLEKYEHYGSDFESKQKVEDLLWLKQSNLPIVVEENTYFLPDDSMLLNTARFYKVVEEMGYPVPSQIKFRKYNGENYAGGYFDDANKIDVTHISSSSTIVHEGAHHQSDENEKFSQEKFEEMVLKASQEANLDVKNSDLFINPYVLEDPNANSSHEDYAETIAHYFTRGPYFRQKLNDLYVEENPAYKVLQAKYDFAKAFFAGQEFLWDGDEFRPKVGDVFEILDSYDYSGIYLRPEPSYVDNPDYPRVDQSSQIRILEGPVEVSHPVRGVRKMWRVEEGYVFDDDFQKYELLRSGWISEDWFGRILLHAEDQSEPSSDLDKRVLEPR